MNYQSPTYDQKLKGHYGCRHCGHGVTWHGTGGHCLVQPRTFDTVPLGEVFYLGQARLMKVSVSHARRLDGRQPQYVEFKGDDKVEMIALA
jgi:hypothetical protein